MDKQKKLAQLLRKAKLESEGPAFMLEDIDRLDEGYRNIKQLNSLSKGDTGDAGYSPVRGKDYFTPEDVQKMVEEAAKLATPTKGVDYFDGLDGKDGADGVDGEEGKTPQKGIDYLTPEEVQAIKDELKGQDGSSVDVAMVIEAIKGLKGQAATDFSKKVGGLIDISHIRNASSFRFNGKKYKVEELMHGSGGGSGSSANVVTQYSLTGTQVGSDVVVALSQLTFFSTFTNVIAAMRNQIPQTPGITCTISATSVTFLNADASEIFSITYAYSG